jgi:hypothetical protein
VPKASSDAFQAQHLDQLQDGYARVQRMQAEAGKWLGEGAGGTSPAAKSLAYLASGIAHRALSTLRKEYEAVQGGAQFDPPSSLNQQLRSIARLLRFVEQSTDRSLHPVLSPTVQSALDELGVQGEVLVTATPALTYELEFLEPTEFAPLVEKATLDRIRWPFLVFLIPRPPRDWPLHHVLVLHEVGHAVFRAKKLLPYLKLKAPSWIKNSKQDQVDKFFAHQQEQIFLGLAGRWAEELFGDAFGLLSGGPAFLQAFCHVVAAIGGHTQATHSHPPTALRIALMAKAARPREYLVNLPPSAMQALCGWINEAEHIDSKKEYRPVDDFRDDLQALSELDIGELDIPRLVTDMGEEMIRVYPTILKLVERELHGRLHTRSVQDEDQKCARQLAELNIPTIETASVPSLSGPGVPLSAARIFSRHWLAYYLDSRHAKATTEIDKKELWSLYGERVLGALDGAEALRAWRTVSGTE